jgi:hypothetical protein
MSYCAVITIISSVEVELRSQATACCYFCIHLLGDLPSNFVVGVVNDRLGVYWGLVLATMWSGFAILFWGVAYNVSVSPI